MEPMRRTPQPQNPLDKQKPNNGDDPKDLTKTINKPNSNKILDRMKRVDKDLSKRYHQRSGE